MVHGDGNGMGMAMGMAMETGPGMGWGWGLQNLCTLGHVHHTSCRILLVAVEWNHRWKQPWPRYLFLHQLGPSRDDLYFHTLQSHHHYHYHHHHRHDYRLVASLTDIVLDCVVEEHRILNNATKSVNMVMVIARVTAMVW